MLNRIRIASHLRHLTFIAAALIALGSTATAAEPGKAIYEKTCAQCHDHPEITRAPALDTLKRMRVQELNYALTQGKMQTQAAGLSKHERDELIEFLAGKQDTADNWTAGMMCPANDRKVNLDAPATVATFGFDRHNHRRLTREQTGLATADFANLQLAWAIGFPKATTMRSQPAIVGTTMFLPVADTSQLYAIDIAGKPCIKWVYQNEIPFRTGTAYGELPGSKRKVILTADVGAFVHMIDAETGQRIWRQRIALYDESITTGTPVLYKDRVYAPLSQYEITTAGDPKHQCCKTHGAVMALDAYTGKIVWTMHTMADAKPLRDRGDGKMYYGPSGAPIWNSPVIDEKRNMLYVGTGEATSEPADKNTDAVLAVDMNTGAIKWSYQATADDIFVGRCMLDPKGLNCPKAHSVYRDVDFGASLILGKGADDRDLIFAGQKAGALFAFDPDNGKVVWKQAFGEGSPLGGIHWGIAYDGQRIFAPINRPYGFRGGSKGSQKPGMHAVDAATGKVAWTFVAEPDCSGDRQTRVKSCATNIGMSGAPTVIDGAVVEGSIDGFLRVFDAKTGAVIFKYDTAHSFDTVNGVPGNGGAVDNASIVAANGMLFVNSGYGMFGEMPGNVLLAFKPKPNK